MNLHYEIPRVFLNRYVNILTPEAFAFLVRFYKFYLDHDKKDIVIPFGAFKKKILVSNNTEEIKRIIGELIEWNLLDANIKKNIYELNLTRIKYESLEHLEKTTHIKGERFRIQVTGKKKIGKGIKPGIPEFVDKILVRYPPKLAEKLKKLIEGLIEYFLNKEGEVKLHSIHTSLMPIIETQDDKIIEKLCDIYNNNINMFGKVGHKYIHATLNNLKNGKTFEKEKENFKQESLDEFKKLKEESDRRSALKIVTGDVENYTAYKALMKLNDYDELKRLYKIGIEILKESNKQDRIYKGYEWL